MNLKFNKPTYDESGRFLFSAILLGTFLIFNLAATPADALEDLLIADADQAVINSDTGLEIPSEPGEQLSTVAPDITDPLPVLNIDSALGLARENNRNILMATQAVEIARAAGRTSLAGFNPDLSFIFNYTRYGAAQTIELPDMDPFVLQAADSIYAGLSFSYPLYHGGNRGATRRVNEADNEIATLQLEQAVNLIDMATVDAYCSAREGFGGLAVRQASYGYLVELERQAQAMYDTGYMPLSDLLAVQVAKAAAHQRVVEWTNNIQTRQSMLNLFMGVDVASRWTIEPVHYPVVEIPFTLETLTDWALENRPELDEIRLQREKILAQIDSIRASEGPNVDLEAGYSRAGSEFNFSDSSATLSAGISVWWDLYNFGRTDDLLAPLEAQLTLMDIQEEELEQQVRQEVESALLSLDTQYYNVQVTNQSLVQAEEALRVANRRFEEGLAIMVEVLDAQSTWTSIGASTVFSSHAYYRVLAMLAQTVGISTRDMIALIEAAGDSEQ